MSLLTFSKVLEKRCSFGQNSPKFYYVKLVQLTNSSPFNFLHVGLINCYICPNVCSVPLTHIFIATDKFNFKTEALFFINEYKKDECQI